MTERLTATAPVKVPADPADGYADFEALVRTRVAAVDCSLFTTNEDPDSLWATYLDNLPADRRQHYNCHTCRRFVQRYGGLVEILPNGLTNSPLWHSERVPSFFAEAAVAVEASITRAKVTGVFLSSEATWGTPQTGPWTHLSAANPRPFADPILSADQVMAEKAEDFKTLVRGLADYPPPLVREAVRVLRSDALTRSEKAVAVAEWFMALHDRVEGKRGSVRTNLIWLAVAEAPPGFCHVRSAVIHTLLDDIKDGLDFASVSRRWAEKMHPLQYQRPTAAPTSGAIDRAEKVFAQLDAAPALARRFATLDDVPAKLWVPRVIPVPPAGGTFGHLRSDPAKVVPLELPAGPITWEKFARDVLPTAEQLEVLVPPVGPFYGLVTAADPAARPILQWDGLDGMPRNPASWYFYVGGSPAHQWGQAAGAWAGVSAVFRSPHRWQRPDLFAHHADLVMFALPGCRDGRSDSIGSALFPEDLRAEFREVRSVIEAHSRTGKIQGRDAGNANGLAFPKGVRLMGLPVRVRTAWGPATYTIDRWD